MGAGSQGLGAGKGRVEGRRGLKGALSPLTKFIPIKLRVEVPHQVKGHLDLISHLQPPAGDGLPQVLGQGGSEAQARTEIWGGGCSLRPPGGPCVLGRAGRGLGSDLFWARTLVYTELVTPEWYSSGGMTPGRRGQDGAQCGFRGPA